MCQHEQKNCPHCNTNFECRVGDVVNCQCSSGKLTDKEREFIASRYTDCLCAGCMLQLKTEYHQLQQKQQLHIFLRGR